MDGERKQLVRRIARRFEQDRLEDQVWALAYELIWPVVRKIVKQLGPIPRNKAHRHAPGKAPIARRA